MTKDGRLKTHLNCLAQGKPSPYMEEFKDYNENNSKDKEKDSKIIQEKEIKRSKKK